MFCMENNTDLNEVKALCISAWEKLKAAFDYLDRATKCTDKDIVRMMEHISQEEFKHAAMHIATIAKMDNNFCSWLYDFMNADSIVDAEEHNDSVKPQQDDYAQM